MSVLEQLEKPPPVELVSAEQLQQMYAWYTHFRPAPEESDRSHNIVGLGLEPCFSFDPGAKQDIIAEHEAGRGVLFAGHHVSNHDPRKLSRLPYSDPDLWYLRDSTSVLAKIGLFANPHMRRVVDGMRAVPTIREKDAAKMDETAQKLYRRAGGFVSQLVIDTLEAGDNFVVFVNGERTAKGKELIVPKPKRGIGHMHLGVAEEKRGRIAPFSLYYQRNKLGLHRAYIHIGALSVEKFKTARDVTGWLQPALQTATTSAYNSANRSWLLPQ